VNRLLSSQWWSIRHPAISPHLIYRSIYSFFCTLYLVFISVFFVDNFDIAFGRRRCFSAVADIENDARKASAFPSFLRNKLSIWMYKYLFSMFKFRCFKLQATLYKKKRIAREKIVERHWNVSKVSNRRPSWIYLSFSVVVFSNIISKWCFNRNNSTSIIQKTRLEMIGIYLKSYWSYRLWQ